MDLLARQPSSNRRYRRRFLRIRSAKLKGKLEEKTYSLRTDGFSVFRGIAIDRIKMWLNQLDSVLRLVESGKENVNPHVGRVMCFAEDPIFLPIVLDNFHFDLLRFLNFVDCRLYNAFLISKPPWQRALHWHQDWWGWSHPSSYAGTSPLVYLMYYLTNTCRANGCLRVIPGSHTSDNSMHAFLRERSTHPDSELPDEDKALSFRPDEIDLAVSAGDVVVRDGRLLHASHPNTSTRPRNLLILAFVPRWDEVPAALQCAFDRKRPRLSAAWDQRSRDLVLSHSTTYAGLADPIELQRHPNFAR